MRHRSSDPAADERVYRACNEPTLRVRDDRANGRRT